MSRNSHLAAPGATRTYCGRPAVEMTIGDRVDVTCRTCEAHELNHELVSLADKLRDSLRAATTTEPGK